jgi:hypothetical protein
MPHSSVTKQQNHINLGEQRNKSGKNRGNIGKPQKKNKRKQHKPVHTREIRGKRTEIGKTIQTTPFL